MGRSAKHGRFTGKAALLSAALLLLPGCYTVLRYPGTRGPGAVSEAESHHPFDSQSCASCHPSGSYYESPSFGYSPFNFGYDYYNPWSYYYGSPSWSRSWTRVIPKSKPEPKEKLRVGRDRSGSSWPSLGSSRSSSGSSSSSRSSGSGYSSPSSRSGSSGGGRSSSRSSSGSSKSRVGGDKKGSKW